MCNALTEMMISDQAFARLRECSLRTLQRERASGTGPAFVRWRRKIFYRLTAIEEWIKRNEIEPLA